MRSNIKTHTLGVALCLMIILCSLGAAVYLVYLRNDADEKCAAKGATAVSIGRSNYLCITPDGRIVGNP